MRPANQALIVIDVQNACQLLHLEPLRVALADVVDREEWLVLIKQREIKERWCGGHDAFLSLPK